MRPNGRMPFSTASYLPALCLRRRSRKRRWTSSSMVPVPPRLMAMRPVRIISLTPYCSRSSYSVSILSSVPVTSRISESCATSMTLARKMFAISRIGAAGLVVRRDADQRQLTRDHGLGRDVFDLHDLDDLEELLRHLVDVVGGAVDGEGHAREAGDLGVANRQRLDVEAALPPLRGDAVEHAGLVLDQRDDGPVMWSERSALAAPPSARESHCDRSGRLPASRRASRPSPAAMPPAGPSGRCSSVSSTTNSMSTGPS